MSHYDAASRLRMIVAQKKQIRGELPVCTSSLLPKEQNQDITSGYPNPCSKPVETRSKSWYIWGALNIIFVYFYLQYVAEQPALPIPQAILPLTHQEQLELLQFSMERAGLPIPDWTKKADVPKKQLLGRILTVQEPQGEEGATFAKELNSVYKYNEYHALRDTCNWTTRELSNRDFFTYKYYATTPLWERYNPEGRNSKCAGQAWSRSRGSKTSLDSWTYPDTQVQQCGAEAKRGRYGQWDTQEWWEVIRVGPFKSYGGNDWHQVWQYDAFTSVSHQLRENPVVWITGHFAAVVDANPKQKRQGQILGYPPVKTERIRVASTGFTRSFPNHNALFLHRADSQLDSKKDDSIKQQGRYTDLDQKYAFPVYHPLQLDAELNDVRKPHSPELSFYLEVGLRWSLQRPPTPLASFHLHSPLPVHSAPPFKRWSDSMMHWVPPTEPSVNWFTGKMVHDGKLLQGLFHSEQRWTDSVFLFSSTPNELGLDQGEFRVNYKEGRVFLPEDHGIDLLDVKQIVLFNAFKNNVSIRCHTGTGLEEVALDPFNREIGSENELPYERQPEVKCLGNWNFHRGDPWTIVSFNRPMCQRCSQFRGPGGGLRVVPQYNTFSGVFAYHDDPVKRVNYLGKDQVDHYITYGADTAENAFTATANSDTVTALQTGALFSKYFPPESSHRKALRSSSQIAPILDSSRRNVLLDELCKL